ncbi:translocon at the outer envelope membrane of chloroplasts [Trifolium repens]|nr:translocon at the outer envelope membrane of chloroplasts [Trifolium repens]
MKHCAIYSFLIKNVPVTLKDNLQFVTICPCLPPLILIPPLTGIVFLIHPTSGFGQVTKDKKDANLQMEKESSVKYGEGQWQGMMMFAYGGSLEAQLWDKNYPLGRLLSMLGLFVMDWHGDLVVGCNLQSQILIGRHTNLVARANLNNLWTMTVLLDYVSCSSCTVIGSTFWYFYTLCCRAPSYASVSYKTCSAVALYDFLYDINQLLNCCEADPSYDNKTIGDDARELIISDLDPQILSPPVYKDFLLNYAEIKFN